MSKWLLILLTFCAASAWSQTAHFESAESKRLDPTSETDNQIQTLQDHVKAAPGDYAGYDWLGFAFFQKARETGDISYYDLAEKTLDKALALAPQDFRAADPLVHMAVVYMGEHRFSDALAYAQRAIGTGSGNLAAFDIEGDAYTDMGDYNEAATAYNTLQALGRAISSPLALAYMSDSRIGLSVLLARRLRRVDNEFGEGACCDTTPVFDEGGVFGRLASSPIHRRIDPLHEMRLPNRTLSASFGYFSQPGRDPFRRIDLI